jgi:hypothetical protein
LEDQESDQVQAFTEALTGRRVTTVGDEAEELPSEWLYGAVIAAGLAANYAVFRYFGASYFDWYVANGSKLALALTLLSLAVKLDDEPGLIAAHPTNYVASWLAFFGQGFLWLSNITRPESYEPDSFPVWDSLVTLLFALVWTAAAFAWLAVVVPAQYCVNLVCGAPVRQTLATAEEVIVERRPLRKPRPGRRWLSTKATRINVGLTVREKPVTATAAISAAALFALSLAV